MLVRAVPLLSAALVFAGTGLRAAEARAQEAPPAETTPKPKKKRQVVAPGFEASEAPQAEGEAEGEPAKTPKGRDLGQEEPDWEEELRKPIDVPDQGENERLIEDLNTALGEVTLSELLDEILADVMAEIDRRPAKWFSPMAIHRVYLGANIVPSFSARIRSAIAAQLRSGTQVRLVECVECELTRTRLEGKSWVISRGLASTEEMRQVAAKLGVRSFMDVKFGFEPDTGVLEMDFKIFRAEDGVVLWSESFRADETTPILMRSSEAPIKRRDRLRDLEMLLEGRPYYGYMASAGFMLIPHDDPVEGDIGGATAGYRIYERFGPERQVLFGLDLQGFLNADRLAGAVISAGSWWIPLRPDLVNPELRLGAKAGAFVAGTAGNAAVFQLGAEVLLRYRFGLFGYVLFMTKSTFPPDTNQSLGGLGFSTGMSFNW